MWFEEEKKEEEEEEEEESSSDIRNIRNIRNITAFIHSDDGENYNFTFDYNQIHKNKKKHTNYRYCIFFSKI